MSIGSVIRTEGPPISHQAWARARGPPMMVPRQYRPRPHMEWNRSCTGRWKLLTGSNHT